MGGLKGLSTQELSRYIAVKKAGKTQQLSRGIAVKKLSQKFAQKLPKNCSEIAQKLLKNKGSDSIGSFRFPLMSELEAIPRATTPLPTVALPMPDAGYGESPRSPPYNQEHQRQRNRQQSHSHRLR